MIKKSIIIALSLFLCITVNACRNTISNNTKITFKVAEVKQDNADLKQVVFLPDEYVNNEELARTLKPGEETDFGGHRLPQFMIFIYKESSKKWHPLLYVKQVRCAPEGSDPSRFPENKYLLMTDLLKRQLPGDYQEVYKFTLKAKPSELSAIESVNTKELTKIRNPYQELYNIIDEMTQKMQELFSMILKKEIQAKTGVSSDNTETDAAPKSDTEPTCAACVV